MQYKDFGACYDRTDVLMTDGVSVVRDEWVVAIPEHSWNIQPGWDDLKIEIQTRLKRDAIRFPSDEKGTIGISRMLEIGLIPTNASGRLQWNVRQSAFCRVAKSIKRKCPSE
ncbi:MAG: hypothetical protein D4R64_06275 [Porphyromonadaceae bacterium]|nr:MAG: hypothetical protein D4R64_06275 [Porphyromonadaceae bacterium]